MTEKELDEFLAGPPPKRKRPEPPKAEAEVIPLPTGAALELAKELGKSKVADVNRDKRDAERYRETAAEHNRRVFAEMRAEREAPSRLMSSSAYQAAGERFNAEARRAAEDDWFDPTQPFGFRR